MIAIVSLGRCAAISIRGVTENIGGRVGECFIGVDACWCSPGEYMGVWSVEITLTWS